MDMGWIHLRVGLGRVESNFWQLSWAGLQMSGGGANVLHLQQSSAHHRRTSAAAAAAPAMTSEITAICGCRSAPDLDVE